MYIYIKNSTVRNIIPDYDDRFPNIPVEQRFNSSYLEKCVHVADDTTVKIGMVYDVENDCFDYPKNTDNVLIEHPIPIDMIPNYKKSKIAESKTKLAEWLANNPLLYSDGKYYSVTEEKQSLLNSNIASYERAKALGIEYPLKWNSTGEECTEWTYESLVTLSLTIAAYVAPKVSHQQSIEIQIKACETAEELDKVVISYD